MCGLGETAQPLHKLTVIAHTSKDGAQSSTPGASAGQHSGFACSLLFCFCFLLKACVLSARPKKFLKNKNKNKKVKKQHVNWKELKLPLSFDFLSRTLLLSLLVWSYTAPRAFLLQLGSRKYPLRKPSVTASNGQLFVQLSICSFFFFFFFTEKSRGEQVTGRKRDREIPAYLLHRS